MPAADFLQNILAAKRDEICQRQKRVSLTDIKAQACAAPPVRDFAAAVQNAAAAGRLPVIAEIKRKSPSKGLLRSNFFPAAIAAEYEGGGAACLSVLTDTAYFGGAGTHLQEARAASALPVLRKDFMLEEWQIYESRALGADAVLLMAAVLPEARMQALAQTAQQLNMAVLAEAHNEKELDAALSVNGAIIGINNRDMATFVTSLQTAMALLPLARAAGRVTVAESGIVRAAEVRQLLQAGADAFLIGETLMRAADAGAALAELFADVEHTG